MAFPSFLRWLFASSSPQEDWRWDRLAKGKKALNAIVHLKQLYYNETSTMVLPPASLQTIEAWTNHLWRLVMDSLQQHSDSPLKPCKTCQRILPATTTYFHRWPLLFM